MIPCLHTITIYSVYVIVFAHYIIQYICSQHIYIYIQLYIYDTGGLYAVICIQLYDLILITYIQHLPCDIGCTYICIRHNMVHTLAYDGVNTYIYMHIYICMRLYMPISIYIQIYIYIHMYTYTNIQYTCVHWIHETYIIALPSHLTWFALTKALKSWNFSTQTNDEIINSRRTSIIIRLTCCCEMAWSGVKCCDVCQYCQCKKKAPIIHHSLSLSLSLPLSIAIPKVQLRLRWMIHHVQFCWSPSQVPLKSPAIPTIPRHREADPKSRTQVGRMPRQKTMSLVVISIVNFFLMGYHGDRIEWGCNGDIIGIDWGYSWNIDGTWHSWVLAQGSFRNSVASKNLAGLYFKSSAQSATQGGNWHTFPISLQPLKPPENACETCEEPIAQ